MGKGEFICHLQFWDFYECEAEIFCMQAEIRKYINRLNGYLHLCPSGLDRFYTLNFVNKNYLQLKFCSNKLIKAWIENVFFQEPMSLIHFKDNKKLF